MSIDENPYQSPPEISSDDQASNRAGSGYWGISYWTAFGLTCIGVFAVFTRNMPPLGFLVIAFLLLAHTAIGSRRFRKRSAVGLVCTLILIAGAYSHVRSMRARAAAQRQLEAARAAATAAEQIAKQRLPQRASGQSIDGDGEPESGE
ncbi:MAG: hypothetical protein KDB00_21255 [Planctomycetales bacterium]|nr:hypothetical protein [Planctomycetales bacterium]